MRSGETGTETEPATIPNNGLAGVSPTATPIKDGKAKSQEEG